MLANPVLFQIGEWRCSLAAACSLLGLVLFVVGLCLIIVLLVRHGRARRLDSAGEVRYQGNLLGGELSIQGPTKEVEASVSFSIGDLRRAHRAGNRLVFWGVPAMLMTWSSAFAFVEPEFTEWIDLAAERAAEPK